jgi:hypothetical protein
VGGTNELLGLCHCGNITWDEYGRPFMDRASSKATMLGPDFDLFGNCRSSHDEAGGYFC